MACSPSRCGASRPTSPVASRSRLPEPITPLFSRRNHPMIATNEMTAQERETAPSQRAETRALVPVVDIFETDRAVVLLADVPGVPENGIELTVDRGVLTLRARSAQSAPA